jgi:hypothetical protein
LRNIGEAGHCLVNKTWFETLPQRAITAIRIDRRTFDVTYSRPNSTILSINNIRPPASTQSISSTDLYRVLGRTFGIDIQGGISSEDNSTTATLVKTIWTSTQNPGAKTSELRNLLRAIITTPVLLFHPIGVNYYKNLPSSNSTVLDLPPELYSRASYVQPIERVIISSSTVIAYTVIALSMYISCVSVLAWAMRFQKAPSSRFPLVDFASRVLSRGFSEGSVATLLVDVTNGNDTKIRERLWKTVLFLGEVEDAEIDMQSDRYGKEKEYGKIGFSTMNDISPLKVGEMYE